MEYKEATLHDLKNVDTNGLIAGVWDPVDLCLIFADSVGGKASSLKTLKWQH